MIVLGGARGGNKYCLNVDENDSRESGKSAAKNNFKDAKRRLNSRGSCYTEKNMPHI